ncbi:o-succinylbenzoate synthase [Demequina oxidasica]|uniref:o-succinylbenzoate synthase n=1 Tax=Demequina oxidasica TaxID=676199 RepID=UPI000AF05A1B|nr:o-succinylbenzoate synthase [Demequina oxidasica]
MEFRPFKVELATTFRGVTSRSGILMRGTGPDGADAWGEYSPFADYGPERAGRWWRAAMEAARGGWPAPVRDQVEVNSIVPELPPAEAARLAVAGGCRTAKVKVGGYSSPMQDAARVEAVAGALGPGGKVRVDANGHWDVDDAVRALTELELAARRGGLDGLEYVEQPCATVDELATLRRRVDTKIAADESIRIPTDPMEVVRKHAADIIVLKVAPLGGVRACLDLAEQVGIPVVVASAMESSVGLAAGIALARALPQLDYACGLGTGALLATDTVRETIVPKDGMLGPVNLDVVA